MDFEEFIRTDYELDRSIKRYDRRISDPRLSRKKKLKALIRKSEAVKKQQRINEDMVWQLFSSKTQEPPCSWYYIKWLWHNAG